MVLSYCSSKVAENLPRLSASTVVARFPDFKILTVAPGYASPEKRTAVLGMLTPPPPPPSAGGGVVPDTSALIVTVYVT